MKTVLKSVEYNVVCKLLRQYIDLMMISGIRVLVGCHIDVYKIKRCNVISSRKNIYSDKSTKIRSLCILSFRL